MSDRELDRRTLLRRGGVVAAGLAGAGALSTLSAPAADAATGGNVVLGQSNTADQTTTVNGTNATYPTLALASASGSVAALQLTDKTYPAGSAPDANIAAGDLLSRGGNLYYGVGASTTGVVLTDYIAPITFGITPVRVVDTRPAYVTSGGRAHVLNASTVLDSKGNLKAGATMLIDVTDVGYSPAAIFGNLTAVLPLAEGYQILWPYGESRPTVSALNFPAGGTHGNAFVVAPGQNATTFQLIVQLYSSQATQVIFDVTALSDLVTFAGMINNTAQTVRKDSVRRDQAARMRQLRRSLRSG